MSKTKKLTLIITASFLLLVILVTGIILWVKQVSLPFGIRGQIPLDAEIFSCVVYTDGVKDASVDAISRVYERETFINSLNEAGLIAIKKPDFASRYALEGGKAGTFLVATKKGMFYVTFPEYTENVENATVVLSVTPVHYGRYINYKEAICYEVKNPEMLNEAFKLYDSIGEKEWMERRSAIREHEERIIREYSANK